MTIGCLFGTFDPPHQGHLAVARHMREACGLDQVWLVVTPQNPFKQDRPLTPDAHRLAMVRLAVAGHEGLVASGFELDLPRPNYTAHTLRFMRDRWPHHAFALIIGSDNLATLHRWKEPEQVLAHHRVLVYPRPGSVEAMASAELSGHPAVQLVVDAPMVDISSTALRADLRAWRPVNGRLSPAVLTYIREHGLYQ
ncbi:MAG: nicotinate (nicotinamide) nucleotide adenylyltransferase [Flavobacteriales bacterium]|jgi:nicotinate-nucleotide adenylyltransferase|nr:nicotinate (nicotinamide) nucleotide adenylyltransferase [Flavobacteriales bacterium]